MIRHLLGEDGMIRPRPGVVLRLRPEGVTIHPLPEGATTRRPRGVEAIHHPRVAEMIHLPRVLRPVGGMIPRLADAQTRRLIDEGTMIRRRDARVGGEMLCLIAIAHSDEG